MWVPLATFLTCSRFRSLTCSSAVEPSTGDSPTCAPTSTGGGCTLASGRSSLLHSRANLDFYLFLIDGAVAE